MHNELINYDFIFDFIERNPFPDNSKADFAFVLCLIKRNDILRSVLLRLKADYFFSRLIEITDVIYEIETLARELQLNKYLLNITFILICLPDLLNEYIEQGLGEALFYETMQDLVYKNNECLFVKGCSGTFKLNWYNAFFQLRRFAFGRFQCELKEFAEDYVLISGYKISKGDCYINVHIPASGIPLTDDVRLESYKRAYTFFKRSFEGEKAVFACNSWLLYPKNKAFLPEYSNTLKFMQDYEIIKSYPLDEFTDSWRVFGSDKPPYKLSESSSSLAKALAGWINSGHKTGIGFGVFLFDGEKIL